MKKLATVLDQISVAQQLPVIQTARPSQIVNERFQLDAGFKEALRNRPVPWGFGQLSETIYFRTYSRTKEDGVQEQWADTIIRVVEGVMSIRKDWYKNVLGKRWDNTKAKTIANALAVYMYDMKLLPPGRGLWAMGTDYVFERGSMSLNNCGYIETTNSLSESAAWMMDALMCGVGVGFSTHTASLPPFKQPVTNGQHPPYVIPDSREGWVESTRMLIESYEKGSHEVHFDYSAIRPAGAPLRGFGGVASGYETLELLHIGLRKTLDKAVLGEISQTRLIADAMNLIGARVVAGGIRNSAQIGLGSPSDEEFLNLKNYDMYPERADIGWMSNNSLVLTSRDDFASLPDISDRIRHNGEPGIINMVNAQKYGRIGDRMEDEVTGVNPCGEILLESAELCNLVEVFPTRCTSVEEIWEAMRLGTFYASTVSLLKSHDPLTNEVVSRNRRIGVSVSGVADWLDTTSVSHVFDVLNRGYEEVVRPTNVKLAKEAGVPASIRLTTVKPSGTISLLAGVSSGMHHPFDGYILRRVRVSKNNPVYDILEKAKVPVEDDVKESNTGVFEFPLKYGDGRTRSVKKVSVYEQAAIVAMLQKAWADNSVSNTLTVQPGELDQIERVLSLFAPQVKSLSLLCDNTDTDEAQAYQQMPLETITKKQYDKKTERLNRIDWSGLTGSDGIDSRFCTNDSCEI